MTFDATELSVEDGSPVELYEFDYQNTYFRYTSAALPVVRSGFTYEPRPIRRSAIQNTARVEKGTLTVRAFRDLGAARLFEVQPPSSMVGLRIYRRHTEDADAEFAAIWSGRVLVASWSGNEVELECEPLTISLRRPGLRRYYQRSCPHILYGVGCNLVAADFSTVVNTFTVVDELTIDVNDLVLDPDNYYAGGYIEYENASTGKTEFRTVRTSSAGRLNLALPALGLLGATEMTVYRGCAHNVDACKTFNNLDNYGGQPYIPLRNPFGGTTVF